MPLQQQLSQEDQSRLLEEFHNDSDDSDNDDELLFDTKRFTFSLSQQSAASSSASNKEQQQRQQQQPHTNSSSTPPASAAAVVDDDHTDNAMTATTTSPASMSSAHTAAADKNQKEEEKEVVMQQSQQHDDDDDDVDIALNHRATKKAMYASMDQVKTVDLVSKLRWHVIGKNTTTKKYYPCVIRDNEHQQAFAKDLKVQLNKQKPILIEYLGFREKVSTGKLAAASKSSLLPYDYDANNNKNNKTGKVSSPQNDNNNNDESSSTAAMPTGDGGSDGAETAVAAAAATGAVVAQWSPTLMASYEKLLKSQSAFAAGEHEDVHVKARAEVMALNRMLQHVVQRQQEYEQQDGTAFSLTQQPFEKEDEEEDEGDDDNNDEESLQDDLEMMQSDVGEPHEQQQKEDSSSPPPSMNVATAAAQDSQHEAKDLNTLRAGDVITYNPPGATACAANRRTSQIVAVYPRGRRCASNNNIDNHHDGISLHLEDGTLLDRDERVLLVKRFLWKRLVPVQKPTWRYINACSLSSKNNNQFAQARYEVLYRSSNQLKSLQQELQREQDTFWQQARTPLESSNSKTAAAAGTSTTAPTTTKSSAPALASSKKDSSEDNATSKDDSDAPICRSQKQAKQDASKKKMSTQKENVGETDVSNVADAAASGASKKRQRFSDVSVGRDDTARTGDIGGGEQSKERKRKASDQVGTTLLPVKENKRVNKVVETKNEKKKQNIKKKNEVSWKVKLQALLEVVRAKRKKSRYDRELVQAQEDSLTTALSVCAHFESSSSSTSSSLSNLLDPTMMDEIANDCDVPTKTLVNYLNGNEKNFLSEPALVELTESLKGWLLHQKDSQKDEDHLQSPLDKETTHVEFPTQDPPFKGKTETSKNPAAEMAITTAAPCAVSNVVQSYGVVMQHPELTIQSKSTTATTQNDAAQEPVPSAEKVVVIESSSLPAVDKSGTENVEPLNHDATQVHQLAVQAKEVNTTHSEPISSVVDAQQQVQQDMPCLITTSATTSPPPVSCPAVSNDVVLATVSVQESSPSAEQTKSSCEPCKKED